LKIKIIGVVIGVLAIIALLSWAYSSLNNRYRIALQTITEQKKAIIQLEKEREEWLKNPKILEVIKTETKWRTKIPPPEDIQKICQEAIYKRTAEDPEKIVRVIDEDFLHKPPSFEFTEKGKDWLLQPTKECLKSLEDCQNSLKKASRPAFAIIEYSFIESYALPDQAITSDLWLSAKFGGDKLRVGPTIGAEIGLLPDSSIEWTMKAGIQVSGDIWSR